MALSSCSGGACVFWTYRCGQASPSQTPLDPLSVLALGWPEPSNGECPRIGLSSLGIARLPRLRSLFNGSLLCPGGTWATSTACQCALDCLLINNVRASPSLKDPACFAYTEMHTCTALCEIAAPVKAGHFKPGCRPAIRLRLSQRKGRNRIGHVQRM